ncbi:unnamed protein product [Medioppia subpectinata]|uniref:Uncharacterized protein n=1 Tax=Medioppia subpectinata TaxID=1979941 RepID=A0A7R9QHK9_9ACAR|nr:unnamed protein product [Medioppia subpectinata]CAG2120948.1 unnamed protein product [Medioppia subpectinata]
MAGRLTAENLCQYSMSKHAAIAFSDGLRRECRKWGVKVSTIEPIIYRTPMAGADYIGPEIERQWRESPDSVRELYGQQYYDHFMARKDRFGSHWSSGTDINEVLDPMVDAIRSSEPRIRYAPAGKWFIQLALSVAQHLPLELYDYLFAHRSRREPKLAALQ